MAKIKHTLFSNGTEHGFWTERNCDRCWKQSRYNEKRDTYTAFRCSIDKEIQLQCAGFDEADMVSKKTIEAVKMQFCPYREEKRKVKKHRPIKGQGGLFE